MRLTATMVAALVFGLCGDAGAEMIEKKGRFGGLDVTYKVVLPQGFNPMRAYPAVLVFTGEQQLLAGAESTLNADWRQEGERRGYILISPGSPNGQLFFEGADRIFPEFLDTLLRDYRIEGNKFHIAGHSNGGLSAFHIASRHPTYFRTITGYPGYLSGPTDLARLQAIKPMCVFFHVGERDPGWRSAMLRYRDVLERQGFRATFTIEPNQTHRLKAQEIDLSKRLFDQIESCN